MRSGHLSEFPVINYFEESLKYVSRNTRFKNWSSPWVQSSFSAVPEFSLADEIKIDLTFAEKQIEQGEPSESIDTNSLDLPALALSTPYQQEISELFTAPYKAERNEIINAIGEKSDQLREISDNFRQSISLLLKPNRNETRDIITTVEGFLDALKNGQVKEVADNIIIESPFDQSVSKFEEGYLYNSELQNAWAGNSFNAYSLLVMNQRFYDKNVTGNPDKISNQRTNVFVNPKVIVALQREVGFPTQTAGDEGSQGNFIIFDRNQPQGVSDSFGRDNITRINNAAIPTLNAFRDQLKQNLFEYIGADNIKPSEDKAVATLDAVWESIFSDPYSESYLNTNTNAMFADYLGVKPEVVASQKNVNYLANWNFGDEKYSVDMMQKNLGTSINDDSIWQTTSVEGVDGKLLYSDFILGDLQTYIGKNIQGNLDGNEPPETQRKQFPKFYRKVLKGLLKKADKNGLQSDKGLPGVSIEERLRSTLRLYFVQRYNYLD